MSGGEYGFLSELGLFSRAFGAGWVGPGDDAAVVPVKGGKLVFSADLLAENVHFRRGTATAADIGYKSLAVNVSDMCAMGASPLCATVTLTVPADLPFSWCRELYEGFYEAEKAFGCPVAGGDLSRGGEVVISVSIIGQCEGEPILRSGAIPGDDLYVSGFPGESGAGLQLLERGLPLEGEALYLAGRHRRPTPRIDLGLALSKERLATSLIDVSDGIMKDAGNIAKRSGVGFSLMQDALPLSDALKKGAALLGGDPIRFALGGGEDYELLFTARPKDRQKIEELSRALGLALTRIGGAVPGAEVIVTDSAGRPLTEAPKGFDHFGGE